MMRKAIMLATVVMVAGLNSARAQNVAPVAAKLVAVPDCTTCPPCTDCSVETRSGLLVRLHQQAVERREEKKEERREKCAGSCCDKSRSHWSKLCDWLSYKPEHRGVNLCECNHCHYSYVIPLWSMFPCQGGCGGSVVAGAKAACATGSCSAGCKTWSGTPSCSTSDQPCMICRFHKD